MISHICQKKNVTLHGEYNKVEDKVVLTVHKNISDVMILDAQGNDGASIGEFEELIVGDIKSGQSKMSSLNLYVPEGKRSFLTLRVNYKIGNRDVDEVVTISLGELNQEQKNEIKNNVANRNGKKLHLFKAD